jgi:hypothetical protein
MQQLLSKIDSKPVAHYAQMYNIQVVQMKGAEGPYFSYNYTGAGFADEHTVEITAMLFKRYADSSWVASNEESDVAEDRPRTSQPEANEEMASKF